MEHDNANADIGQRQRRRAYSAPGPSTNSAPLAPPAAPGGGLAQFRPSTEQNQALDQLLARHQPNNNPFTYAHAPQMTVTARQLDPRPTAHELNIQEPSVGVSGGNAFLKMFGKPKGLSSRLNRKGNLKKRRNLAPNHNDYLDPDLPHSHKRFQHIPVNQEHELVFRGLRAVRHNRFNTAVDANKHIGANQGISGLAHSTDMVAHSRDPYFATGAAQQGGVVYASVIPPHYALDLERYQRATFGGSVDYGTAPQGNLSYEVTSGTTKPEWVIGHKSYDRTSSTFQYTANPAFDQNLLGNLNDMQRNRLAHWRRIGDPNEDPFPVAPMTFTQGRAAMHHQRLQPGNHLALGPGPLMAANQPQRDQAPAPMAQQRRVRSNSFAQSSQNPVTAQPQGRVRSSSFVALPPAPAAPAPIVPALPLAANNIPPARNRSASLGTHSSGNANSQPQSRNRSSSVNF